MQVIMHKPPSWRERERSISLSPYKTQILTNYTNLPVRVTQGEECHKELLKRLKIPWWTMVVDPFFSLLDIG
jgi:hypothetical protein